MSIILLMLLLKTIRVYPQHGTVGVGHYSFPFTYQLPVVCYKNSDNNNNFMCKLIKTIDLAWNILRGRRSPWTAILCQGCFFLLSLLLFFVLFFLRPLSFSCPLLPLSPSLLFSPPSPSSFIH